MLHTEGFPIREGNYLPDYEGYGRLIGRLGESAHQSCVLLTSREKPYERLNIKSISDAAWSQFFEHLSCKAAEAGRAFLKVNPAYTTQECSRCHHRQPMPLSVRTYHCPCCFLVIDRDLNAAINIVGLGLQSRVVPEAPGL